MMKYRKKPVVIEAIEWRGNYPDARATDEWPHWFTRAVGCGAALPTTDGRLSIHTLEGEMLADKGDMIIQGVKGEIYPCKPDIFAATYEPVQD